MKISIVCNLLDGFSGACDATQVIDGEFGNNYIRLKVIEDELLSDKNDLKIEYATMSPSNSLAVK